MPRRPRIEIEGGLYHVISRGNNRQRIFNVDEDYCRMLLMIEQQKAKLPFYLYAYCLMPNHIHLLIERREDRISRIMQRLLTGYAQYYNRRYGKSGHLLQGRYKAILCQSDQYLGELVRYIHLNPVRASLVRKPEGYSYSGHREYLGLAAGRLIDADPLLRHFGAIKKQARERYQIFVRDGLRIGHKEEFYEAEEGRVLGNDEFVEKTLHRVGLIPRGARPEVISKDPSKSLEGTRLVRATEEASGVAVAEFCSPNRNRSVVEVKEAMILIAVRNGMSRADLAELMSLDESVVSRRETAARIKMRESATFRRLVTRIQSLLTAGSDLH